MSALLDTHFLIWITTRHSRLRQYPWLDQYQPWTVSPVALLEVAYLAEIGRVELDAPGLLAALQRDPRMRVDDPGGLALFTRALDMDWTRDPFDRLLAAHSVARRIPLCTVDTVIRRHHALLVPEIGTPAG